MHYDKNSYGGLSPELADGLPAYIDEAQRQSMIETSSDAMTRAVAIGRLLRTGDASPPTKKWLDGQIEHFQENETAYVSEGIRVLLLGTMEILGESAPFENCSGRATVMVRQIDDATSAMAFLQQVSIVQQSDTPLPQEFENRKLFADVRKMALAIDTLIADEMLADRLHRDTWLVRISELSADEWWLVPVRAARLFSRCVPAAADASERAMPLGARLTAIADERLAASDDLPRMLHNTAQFVLRLSKDSLLVILEEPASSNEAHPVTLEATGVDVLSAEPMGQGVFSFPLTHKVFLCPTAILTIRLSAGPLTLALPMQ